MGSEILLNHKGFFLFSVNMDRSGSKGDKLGATRQIVLFLHLRKAEKQVTQQRQTQVLSHLDATGANPGHTECQVEPLEDREGKTQETVRETVTPNITEVLSGTIKQ